METVLEQTNITLDVENFSIIDDYSNSQNALVEVWVCHDGNNAHNMPIELSVLKKAKKTLINKYLVAGYSNNDFEGHEEDERIVGFFPESSKMSYKKKDGKTYLVAEALMSKVYANWAYEVFVNDNNRSVSMEIGILDSEERDDGLTHITEFVFAGVTLLGLDYNPACKGADATIIRFSKEDALKDYASSTIRKRSSKIKNDFANDMNHSRKEDCEMTKVKEDEFAAKEIEEEVKESDVYMEEDSKEEEIKEEKMEDSADEKEEETEEVEEKEEDFADEGGSLLTQQKYNIFEQSVKDTLGCGQYISDYDDNYIYVYNWEDGVFLRYSYSLVGVSCNIDIESKARVMRGGFIEFTENKTPQTIFEEDFSLLKDENEKLKKEMLVYQTQERDIAVEGIIAGVSEYLSNEQITELKAESKEFSLENISMFENKVKALAFEVIEQGNIKIEKENITRYQVPEPVEKKSKYDWD